MAARTIHKLLAMLILLSSGTVKGQELEELTPGDHIYTYRRHGLYTHHGIYIGGGYVIHFTRAGVDMTSLQSFRTEGEHLHSVHSYAYGRPLLEYCLTRPGTRTTLPDTKSPEDVVNKAWELLAGDSFGEYDLFNNNCEHFATFCSTGVRASAQTALISALQQKVEGAIKILQGNRAQEVKEWTIKILQGMKLK